ncbi:hypothetical protein [Saccharothrix sp. Mg75]|uniref:hypothetical protein n=1 Tax=Saccharothrix sp. Mg75 TaxID=3445357 RepID=UPI003EE901B5
MSRPLVPRQGERTIVAVDVEGSTTRSDDEKAHIRVAMYDLFQQALSAAGVAGGDHDPLIDRGDGILALIRRRPLPELVHPLSRTLTAALTDHNRRWRDRRFRLRLVVHTGLVRYDRRGCFGRALDVAFRLLDSEDVKAGLRRTTAPLIFVISEAVPGAPPMPLCTTTVLVGSTTTRGGIHVPALVPSPRSAAR